jgi:gluconate 2-dehydrogenase alpha chain
VHDELRYAQRHDLMQDVTRDTLTFRNKISETALPMRQLGSFLPGNGVGGAGVHWNGVTWRWLPWDHEPHKRTVERYGKDAIPADMILQDWGVTYDELEPYYEKFEYTCGVSGKAGNLNGEKIAGGNVFEGARKRDYPNPPLIQTQASVIFEATAKQMGYHPFPHPAANASRPYTNPDGSSFGACHYCGFCERFGCEAQAKASPHMTVIPLALQHDNVRLKTNTRVLKVNLDSTGKRATGVTYLDARGQEFEQPAELVLLTAYMLNNVHLMLLSGIGKPYDPQTGQGVVGRNYSYQVGGGANVFFDEKTIMNPFMGAGALSTAIADFDGDSFDHLKEGFIGGATIQTGSSGARPIGYHPTPSGTPRWGSEWKAAVAKHYNHAQRQQLGQRDALQAELSRPRSDL